MEVLQSKIQLPDLSPYMTRTGLYELMDQNLSRSLICITGGSGYGKTTLISGYLRSKQIPAVWYQITQCDSNPYMFVTYLLAAFSAVKSHKALSEPVTISNYKDRLAVLLRVLSSWNQPLIIVLDDFHWINQNEEISNIVSQLIELSSSHVTTVLCSRVRPSLPLVKWRIRQQLCLIQMEQLAFTLEETAQLLNIWHELKLDSGEIEMIHQKTGGWAVSLTLIADAIRGKDTAMRRNFWSRLTHVKEDLFEYISSEVIESLSPGIQEFLYKTSLLYELQPEILKQYLSGNSYITCLDYLENNHLFIQKKQSGSLQYLPIFRSFLYEKFVLKAGENEIKKLHQHAAKVYESEYQYFHALAHFIAIKHFADAARLIKKMLDLYTPERFLYLMDGTVENLVPEFPRLNFNLFLCRCIPASILKRFIQPLQEMIRSLEEAPHHSLNLALLKNRLGLILFYSGYIPAAKEQILGSLAISQDYQEQHLIALNLTLVAQCCRFTGEIEEGMDFAKRALTHSESHGITEVLIHTFWIFLELLLEQGELFRAEQFFQELIRLSEIYEDVGARIYPFISIGKYFRLRGSYEDAMFWVEKGISETQKSSIDVDLAWGYTELGLICLELNDAERARKCFQIASKNFEDNAYFQKALSEYNRKLESPAPVKFVATSEIHSEQLIVRTLGRFCIWSGGRQITIKRKSSLRLFQYLLIHYGKKIPKDVLLENLFSEGDYTSRKNRLFVSISILRKSLEPHSTGRNSKFVIQAGDSYFLDTADMDLDLIHFHKLTGQKDISGELDIQGLQLAEQIYGGDLFAEYPYEGFLEPERERLRRSYFRVLQELGTYYWKARDYILGMDYFERSLELDLYAEQPFFDYISSLLQAGFIKNAKNIAEKMEKRLETELGISVKDRIQAIFQKHEP